MKIEIWPINRPIPYARNARIIPQAAIDKVAGSISEFGFRQPIVIDKDGIIVAGHTRLLAAQKLGLKEVPVHVASELTPIQIKAYRLADNRVNQES
jgi:ParB-like chromosome segregation protein Spo0J